MKIALVNPRQKLLGDAELMALFQNLSGREIFRHKFSGFGLGLLTVAALTPPEYEIEIIDENWDPLRWDIEYDLVGITANTAQANRAYEIAAEYMKTGTPVVIGGIHATVLPQEAKSHATSVIVGEAERTWPKLIDDFRRGQLRPYYREEAEIDLSKSPTPRYELLKQEKYDIVWVQTTRGCPHDCEFCAASRVYGRKYRRKTVDQVMKEIHRILQIWERPQISFADDNMFVDKKYSTNLLREVKKLGIKYFAQCDISVAEDEEFLDLLRASGCNILFIGFETLSEAGLAQINRNNWKARYVNRYEEYVDRIQRRGIGVMGAFVLGLDEDDTSVFDRLTNFIIRNNLYAAQVTVLTPLPGSRTREKLLGEKRITDLHDWDRYTCNHVTILPLKMSPAELREGFLSVHKRIYGAEANMQRLNYFKEIYRQNRKEIARRLPYQT